MGMSTPCQDTHLSFNHSEHQLTVMCIALHTPVSDSCNPLLMIVQIWVKSEVVDLLYPSTAMPDASIAL